ncbi:MAG TPA: FecR domain-containing protein [Candidatus Butyricimonas faecavium]|nr:FecR domain-containing protein [Candidatus Butyricimonas faecavium]
MDKSDFDIAVLVGKYLADNLTDEEQAYLNKWLSSSVQNGIWFYKLTDENYKKEKLKRSATIDIKKGWQSLQKKRSGRSRRQLWIRWSKYAAIFIVPILVVWITYQQFSSPSVIESPVQVIAAGSSKALLVLADGTSVPLKQDKQGVLVERNGVKIDLKEERVEYENAVGDQEEELIYNELIIPRGGEYSLTLSDGTVVYLNAGSKLRFPVRFGNTKREVELEGEGYFEVTHDEKVPFVVKTLQMDVQVLGTKFNISAYEDDAVTRATLVQGSVKVTASDNGTNIILQPNEQAEVKNGGQILEVIKVDASFATAWKDGKLRFQEKPLCEIMKIVARWYDVEVEYVDEEVKNYPFGCNFSRHATIEPLLQVFEATGTVKIRVDGRKILIMKKK